MTDTPTTPAAFITTAEVAERLGVSERSVRRAAAAGWLPSHRLPAFEGGAQRGPRRFVWAEITAVIAAEGAR